MENISIRDFRSILELILIYDCIVTDNSKYFAIDYHFSIHEHLDISQKDNIQNYIQYIRTGLRHYQSLDKITMLERV